MDFVASSEEQQKSMLHSIGLSQIEELLAHLPKSLTVEKPTQDDGLSEAEGLAFMQQLAAKNSFSSARSFLGAGSYDHHIPAIVPAILSKSEFLTAYTPYQAECSQGMLQAIYEFQTATCALTGLDVACASLYDGPSAAAEALLMALRHNKRTKVLIADSTAPNTVAVVKQYLGGLPVDIELHGFEELEKHLDSEVSAVLVQSPNFFGHLEELSALEKQIHEKGALLVLASNPLAYGLFQSASDQGADIAVGDLQPLGLPMGYGGPSAGYLSCRKELVRQLPGRLIGESVDTEGTRAYTITLQAREQHIRREKATSNICTNQTLCALASLITLSYYGEEGFSALSRRNYENTAYLKEKLQQVGVKVLFSERTHFNELLVEFPIPAQQALEHFRKAKIEAGVPIHADFPHYKNALLVAVTEKKTQAVLDEYIEIAAQLGRSS